MAITRGTARGQEMSAEDTEREFGSVVLLADTAALRQTLQAFADASSQIEALAATGLEVGRLQGRERTFASSLLRNATGAHLAASAWCQELMNR